MNSLISIIIPAYNAEDFIARAIESVLNQTYKNIEIIIIDDGSNDNTSRIVKTYVNNKVHYYYQENQGVAVARNYGIEKAKGNYIGFLDADDYVLPQMYSKLLNKLIVNESDFSMCNIYLENKQNNRVKFLQINESTYDLNEPKDLIEAFASIGKSCWNKLFKSSLIKEIRFPKFKRGEDSLFVLEALLNSSKISTTHEALYVYFQNSNSVTKSEINLAIIDNYIEVHTEKRNLINKHQKDKVLKTVLKDYYVTTFLRRSNAIRKIKKKSNKEKYWKKWLNINEMDFIKETSLLNIIKVSRNINWVYYAGMIISGGFFKRVLVRISNMKFYLNKY